MKKKHTINKFLTTSIFLFTFILLTLPEKSFSQRFNYISAGYNINYFFYEERGESNQFLDSEEGAIHGGNIRFNHILFNIHTQKNLNISFFINANTELSHSPTVYSGFLQPSWTPYNTTTFNTFFRIETHFGVLFHLTNSFSFSIYTGIGYNLWARDINNGRAPGYLEHYKYFYFPIGLKIGLPTFDFLSLTLDISVRSMQFGKVTAFWSKLKNPTYPYDVNVELPSTFIFRIELQINFHLNANFGIAIIPWFSYVSMDRSTTDQTYLEKNGWDVHIPKNKTTQVGAHINFTYYFGSSKNTVTEEPNFSTIIR